MILCLYLFFEHSTRVYSIFWSYLYLTSSLQFLLKWWSVQTLQPFLSFVETLASHLFCFTESDYNWTCMSNISESTHSKKLGFPFPEQSTINCSSAKYGASEPYCYFMLQVFTGFTLSRPCICHHSYSQAICAGIMCCPHQPFTVLLPILHVLHSFNTSLLQDNGLIFCKYLSLVLVK